MPENVLEQIIHNKQKKIADLKKNLELNYLQSLIDKNSTFIDFKKKIEFNNINEKFSIIAEIKRQVHQLE